MVMKISTTKALGLYIPCLIFVIIGWLLMVSETFDEYASIDKELVGKGNDLKIRTIDGIGSVDLFNYEDDKIRNIIIWPDSRIEI